MSRSQNPLPEAGGRGWIPSAAAVCCDVLLLRSLLLFLALLDQEGRVQRLPSAALWAAAALVTWGLFRAFAAKPRALPALVLAGAAGVGAQLWVVLAWGGAQMSGVYALLLGAAVMAGALHGGWMIFHPVNAVQTGLYLDAGALLFLYFLAVPAPWEGDPYLLHLLLAAAVSLLSLAWQRLSGGRMGARGGGLLGVLSILWGAALAAAFAAVFLIFFSEAAGRGLVALLDALERGVDLLLGALGAVISFLLSLLPQGAGGSGSPYLDQAQGAAPPAAAPEEVVEVSPILGMIFFGAMAALLVWAALRWLWRMRRVRVGGRAGAQAPVLRRSRGKLLHGLGLRLREMGRALGLLWRGVLLRNTPAGTLAWLERRGRLRGLGRRRGETIRAYLDRLARWAQGQERPEAAQGLRRLADWLDRSCYSPAPPPPPSREELRRLRRSFTSARNGS